MKALVTLIERGAGDRAVVSHDSVWCMLGQPFPAEMMERMKESMDPRRFSTVIVPQMLDAGITQAQIDALLVDNPRRFFAQEERLTEARKDRLSDTTADRCRRAGCSRWRMLHRKWHLVVTPPTKILNTTPCYN